MPIKPKSPCRQHGCTALVPGGGFCDQHKKQRQQQQDRERGTAAQRGYDSRWRTYRESYLKQHPLCVECLKEGRVIPAIVVDHIKPHKGDKRLFWDTTNHQALCKPCHDRKTVKEDGGFGKTVF